MENQQTRNEEFADLMGKMGWLYTNSFFEAQKTLMERLQKAMMQKPDESSNPWQAWASYATEWAQNLLKQMEQIQKAAANQMSAGGSASANPWQAWASLATEFAQNYMNFLTSLRKVAEDQKPADAASGELWEQWTSCATECAQKFMHFMDHMQKAAAGQKQ